MITYHLTLKGQDPRVLYSDMEFVAGDVGAYRLIFKFFDGDTPISLAQKAVAVKIKRADGVVLSDSGEIAGDTAIFTPKNECFSVPGAVVFEVALCDSNQTHITTKIIRATVLRGVGEPEMASSDNVSVYVSLLSQAQGKIDAANALLNRANETLTATQNLVADKADALKKVSEVGKDLSISDTTEGDICALSIFGESVQNGTPAPLAPVPIVSVETPTITVGDTQITIPLTLRGIGNKRDEIAVDKAKGRVTLIRRVAEITLESRHFAGAYLQNVNGVGALYMIKSALGIPNGWSWQMKMASYRSTYGADGCFSTSGAQNLFMVFDNRFTDKETAISLLTGEKMVLVLAEPTETDVTDTDWGRALLDLKTSRPKTQILCAADVCLTYRADTTEAYNGLKDELDALKQAIISLGGTI